jgi:hypothetical protein
MKGLLCPSFCRTAQVAGHQVGKRPRLRRFNKAESFLEQFFAFLVKTRRYRVFISCAFVLQERGFELVSRNSPSQSFDCLHSTTKAL